MAALVHLSLSGMAPAYLAADCQLFSDEGRHQLRSATSRTCVVRRTFSNYGDRCFAAAGPKLWNSVTVGLRQLTLAYNDLNGYKRHICSGAEIAAYCDLTVKAVPHKFSYFFVTDAV